MEQRRFFFGIFAFVIGMAYWWGVVPMLHPEWFQPQIPPADVVENGDNNIADPAQGNNPLEKAPSADPKAPAIAVIKPEIHPRREVKLGSTDPASGYFFEVELSSQGAAIASVIMNDPRYKRLDDSKAQLKVLDRNRGVDSSLNSLSTRIPQLDVLLLKHQTDSTKVDWAIDQNSLKEDHVLFYYESPDKSLRAEKEFSIVKTKTNKPDYEADPYVINFEMRLKNLDNAPKTLRYELQGPIGMPLEDPDNARRYIEVQFGFQSLEGEVEYKKLSAQEIVNQYDKSLRKADPNLIFSTKRPLKYLGVDERYFVALLLPKEEQTQHNYFDKVTVELLQKDTLYPDRSPVTFRANSEIVEVLGGKELAHAYSLYVGPKRDELMATFKAGDLMQFGWFSWVSRQMLWIMSTLHDTAQFPYWLAIIVLTVIVRGAMYPMSRRQALSMKHLKEMQPAMTELQLKYKDEKEKLALAQLQLMKEHGVSPLMGCMPFFLIMLQMPIFIGLYNALANAIELRRAPFLYISDLASPDKMFQFPFSIPFLGSDFNLLPILTIVLFLVQQKMYMPPATTEEQKMQQSMMTYMMVFMGFMFYRVPAGLCVYFIASSLWGLVERRILDWHDDAIEKRKASKMQKKENEKIVIQHADYSTKPANTEKSWLQNLWEQVDKAANPKEYGGNQYTKQDTDNKTKL